MRPNREIIIVQTSLLCRQNSGCVTGSLRKGSVDGKVPEVAFKYTLTTNLVKITAGAVKRQGASRISCYLIVQGNKIIQTLPENYMCYDYYDSSDGIASSVFRTMVKAQIMSDDKMSALFANKVRDKIKMMQCLTR